MTREEKLTNRLRYAMRLISSLAIALRDDTPVAREYALDEYNAYMAYMRDIWESDLSLIVKHKME